MMQVQYVDIVGAQLPEALLHVLDYVFPAESGLVSERAFRIVYLRGDDCVVALRLQSSISDTEWAKELAGSTLSEKFVSKAGTVLKRYGDAQDPKILAQIILDVFFR